MRKQTDLAWFCLTKDHCAAPVLLEVGAGTSAAAGQYASISLVFWLAVFTFLHRNTHCSMPSGPMQVVCTKTTEHPYDWLVNQHTGSDLPRSETNPETHDPMSRFMWEHWQLFQQGPVPTSESEHFILSS